MKIRTFCKFCYAKPSFLAELLHKRVRDFMGFGKEEGLQTEDYIKERYRGIRPAAGYPACPDHPEKQALWDLLDVEKTIGMELTTSYAMFPPSSVSGLYSLFLWRSS